MEIARIIGFANLREAGRASSIRTVKIKGGPDLDVQGNILNHEYRIGESRQKVGEVSEKWFWVRDTYGVEVAEGQDVVVILAVMVAIDMMARPTW